VRVANYLQLRDLAPELPFIATLQGQSIADYLLRTSGAAADPSRQFSGHKVFVGEHQ
jgi:hypothetical protein